MTSAAEERQSPFRCDERRCPSDPAGWPGLGGGGGRGGGGWPISCARHLLLKAATPTSSPPFDVGGVRLVQQGTQVLALSWCSTVAAQGPCCCQLRRRARNLGSEARQPLPPFPEGRRNSRRRSPFQGPWINALCDRIVELILCRAWPCDLKDAAGFHPDPVSNTLDRIRQRPILTLPWPRPFANFEVTDVQMRDDLAAGIRRAEQSCRPHDVWPPSCVSKMALVHRRPP
ncbi:hypothetical protein ACCO45_002105 [Purpureocillium lilacinum]|uniref:Uncharacterized protein n=1 Tax=Purpureocillium lilacinum TaxID=33203 RepID=A0ACC4E8Y4_PURLI